MTQRSCPDAIAAPSTRSNILRPTRPVLSELPGLGPARPWGEALAQDLAAFRAGQLLWTDVDPGCLLTGPPGTGKTTFAKALAATCQVPIVSASFAHWQRSGEGHLGDTLEAMHRDFAAACRAAPCILFIDEIDSLPRRRSGGKAEVYMNAVVNGLLQELDGVEGREGVIVIAACNNADNIDEAVLRAGRLDRTLHLMLPSVADLGRIYQYHLGHDAPGRLDLTSVAALSAGASAADVARNVREARRIARRARRSLATPDLIAALMARAPRLDPCTRRRRAVHEAGRAAALLTMELASDISVSLLTPHSQPPRFNCVGAAAAPTRHDVEAAGIALMAGRAAEEVLLGQASACCGGGPESHLANVTRLFRTALTRWGLGRGTPVWLSDEAAPSSLPPAIADELTAMLAIAADRARHLASMNRSLIEALAQHLEKHHVLTHDQIRAIAAMEGDNPGHQSKAMSGPRGRGWRN